jgi:glutathione S-transferase
MIEEVCDSQYEALNWAMGEVNVFRRAEGEKAAKLNAQAKYQVRQIHAWLTEQLGGSLWFGGASFGWADVCVWPMVNRSISYNLEPEPGSALQSWYERARERESVKSVYDEFLAATSGPNKAPEDLRKGVMRRQYRDHRLEWLIKSGGIDIVAEGLEKRNIRFSWPDPME